MKRVVYKILGKLDLCLVHKSDYERIKAGCVDLDLIKSIEPSMVLNCLNYFDKSKAQLRQDLFVLSELGFKRKGFFVEFGATNGVDLSNTFLLEKEFDWDGILAEPGKVWLNDLRKNRKVIIDNRCVWSNSGNNLMFNEVSEGELSTLDAFSESDGHIEKRRRGLKYNVKSVSLMDLLRENDAPREIDYLSIDTEGSELDILKAFDFNCYDIKVITCEHNYSDNRSKIFDLLTSFGYERKMENVSQWDDWYVKA